MGAEATAGEGRLGSSVLGVSGDGDADEGGVETVRLSREEWEEGESDVSVFVC